MDAQFWEIISALGTVGAVVVALALGIVQGIWTKRAQDELKNERKKAFEEARLSVASMVAAWVETNYTFDGDQEPTNRFSATLYVDNQSSEPVKDLPLAVVVGDPPVQLGPLSAPFVIPVLPPHRTRQWDITPGLLAAYGPHGLPDEPVVRLWFKDRHDTAWYRDHAGRVQIDGQRLHEIEGDFGAGQQIGNLENLLNPQLVVLAFLALMDDRDAAEAARFLCKGVGWEPFDAASLESIAGKLGEYELASHVYYPAERVAYIRVRNAASGKVAAGQQAQWFFFTLVFLDEVGWRIYSFGPPTRPEAIDYAATDQSYD